MGVKFICIGKAEDNDYVVNDPHVSRYHAIAVAVDQGFLLCDLFSTNKVYVNKQAIASAEVMGADQVTLGQYFTLDVQQVARLLASHHRNLCDHIQVLGVGNASDNEIVVDDPHVSRYHAVICKFEEGETYIFDRGSSNKVYVNSEVRERAKVKENDQITLGRYQPLSMAVINDHLHGKSQAQPIKMEKSRAEHSGKTTWFKKQMEEIKEQQDREIGRFETREKNLQKSIRKIVGASAAIVAVVVVYLWFASGNGDRQIANILEKNRNAVVMIVHDYNQSTKPFESADSTNTDAIVDQETGVIYFSRGGEGRIEGSGFIYRYRGKPVVITNKHVVQPWVSQGGHSQKIVIKRQDDPREYTAQVLRVHKEKDIALLEIIEDLPEWVEVELAEEQQTLQDGDPVGCMSFSLGDQGQVSIPVKADLLQGKITNLSSDDFKHDIPSAPGASGGPIFNSDGKVIGIIRGGSIDEQGIIWQGFNWGIPIKYVHDIMN